MKVLTAVAWPYANGPRHLGHVAGFAVPSDVFSRYMRMAGHDVLMVSGSDEHGTPILVLADGGRHPAEFVDRNHAIIAGELADLGCSYDLYTRTTTANHYAVAQELFRAGVGQRLHGRADDEGRGLADDRPHPARPLHRGHLPDLRLRRGPRRPVRQLRQPARARGPDQPAEQDQRRDARASSRRSTSSSTCPRSPTPCAAGSRDARPPAPGAPTSSSSASTSSTTSSRAP
jgi:membrane peptidoglycan carboxypeptidase